jgi:hypothetical protein
MLVLILISSSGPRSPAHSEADRLVPVSADLHLGEVAQAMMALLNHATSAFAGFRFPREVISVAVRWYLR